MTRKTLNLKEWEQTWGRKMPKPQAEEEAEGLDQEVVETALNSQIDKALDSAIGQLRGFISLCPSTWRPSMSNHYEIASGRIIHAKVRFSKRVLTEPNPNPNRQNEPYSYCLDIAVIAVPNFRLWNKGICRKFIRRAHESNPWDATFIECVNSRTLDGALRRWGWTFNGQDSYFRWTYKP